MSKDVARQPVNIGLLWHSARSGNLGVGALTVGNIALIQQVAHSLALEPRFTLLSMRDTEVPPITNPAVKIFTIDSKAMLLGSFWHEVGKMDCIIDIGGGDSFAEIYGPKRFAFLWLSKAITIARRVPLLLAPQTIGPFTRQPYKWLARTVMERSDAVVARDEKSRDACQKLAPKANIARSVDVAFVLPFENKGHLRGGPKARVGINASGLMFHEAEAGRNRFGLSYDYARFTRNLIQTLSAREDVEVHLVTHATSRSIEYDDDSRLADRLASEYPSVIRVPDFSHPSEAKSYISGLDMLVSGRMHACIGAYSSRTPVIPVAYSRKFSGLFGMLGYEWIIPATGMTEQDATTFVMDALTKKAAIAAQIDKGLAQVDEKLDIYRDVLRSLLTKAAHRQ